uniref:Uncharacterized protein n=1 Tax=Janibacter limosus TaxID=53458 RepID=A0AC61U222_9MICO|nr:hypothetical protein [Janibacter limosus]
MRGAGLLVPPGDAAAPASALDHVGTDPAVWATMRREGLARADAFTRDTIGGDYVALYEGIGGTGAVTPRDGPRGHRRGLPPTGPPASEPRARPPPPRHRRRQLVRPARARGVHRPRRALPGPGSQRRIRRRGQPRTGRPAHARQRRAAAQPRRRDRRGRGPCAARCPARPT